MYSTELLVSLKEGHTVAMNVHARVHACTTYGHILAQLHLEKTDDASFAGCGLAFH